MHSHTHQKNQGNESADGLLPISYYDRQKFPYTPQVKNKRWGEDYCEEEVVEELWNMKSECVMLLVPERYRTIQEDEE
jgi:hypothetical protein